ncbi:MAG: chromosome segregation ATPase [Parasphingorhabdus sp.]|jgi:chromosome segregation ATPase
MNLNSHLLKARIAVLSCIVAMLVACTVEEEDSVSEKVMMENSSVEQITKAESPTPDTSTRIDELETELYNLQQQTNNNLGEQDKASYEAQIVDLSSQLEFANRQIKEMEEVMSQVNDMEADDSADKDASNALKNNNEPLIKELEASQQRYQQSLTQLAEAQDRIISLETDLDTFRLADGTVESVPGSNLDSND